MVSKEELVERLWPDTIVEGANLTQNCGAAESHENDRAAAHRRRIDRAVEGNRQARLKVEAVKRIDDVDVFAVRRVS